MTISELELRPPVAGTPLIDSLDWANSLYANLKTGAPPPRIRARELVAPVPHPVPGSRRFRMRARVKPETKRPSVFSSLSRAPAVVVVALLVYFLGAPVFWFAVVDLGLYLEQGKSMLGPTMDTIVMVFGGGLVVVSVLSILTTRQGRRRRVRG